MDVYLDGERLDGAGTTLTATLDAARAKCATDRLIVEAYADGVQIPEDHLTEPPSEDPYAQEIKLVSAQTAELIQGPLVQAAESVAALEGRHAEIAHQIQSGEVAAALGELSEVLEAWTNAKTILELAAQVLGPEVGGGASTMNPAVDTLTAALTSLKAALQGQDWSGLADTLEFDLDPLTGVWSDILHTAAANAGG